MTRNRPNSETNLLSAALGLLRSSLPGTWSVVRRNLDLQTNQLSLDAIIDLEVPTGQRISLAVEMKPEIEPREVARVVNKLMSRSGAVPFVIARFLTPATRSRLAELNAGYADTTGNLHLVIDDPLVLIDVRGAERDPSPPSRPLQTLKGRGAGRGVRALCDFVPPYGVRDLSVVAGVAAATLSRVIGLLDRDGLVERGPRGSVEAVDVSGVIRRWAQDYSFQRANDVAGYLEPRGASSLDDKLRAADFTYAVTGSLVASMIAPIAPPRLIQVYVPDVDAAARALDLREADTGANTMLAKPFDAVAFDRTAKREGLTTAALSQVAADLLTGPGRSPSEGEELLRWMEANPDAWRLRA